jgi:hypothetical protein
VGIFYEVIGWIAVVSLLLAFYLNISGKATPDSLSYLILNFIGSLLFVINAWHYDSYQFVLMNCVWLGFSVYKLATLKK